MVLEKKLSLRNIDTTIRYICDTLRMRQFLSQILIIDSTKQTGYNEEKFALGYLKKPECKQTEKIQK